MRRMAWATGVLCERHEPLTFILTAQTDSPHGWCQSGTSHQHSSLWSTRESRSMMLATCSSRPSGTRSAEVGGGTTAGVSRRPASTGVWTETPFSTVLKRKIARTGRSAARDVRPQPIRASLTGSSRLGSSPFRERWLRPAVARTVRCRASRAGVRSPQTYGHSWHEWAQ
jgi:hypothetical protein